MSIHETSKVKTNWSNVPQILARMKKFLSNLPHIKMAPVVIDHVPSRVETFGADGAGEGTGALVGSHVVLQVLFLTKFYRTLGNRAAVFNQRRMRFKTLLASKALVAVCDGTLKQL